MNDLVVAVLVSCVGVFVASVLVSNLVGGLVSSIVFVGMNVLVSVARTVFLLQREAVRAGAVVSLVTVRVVVLMPMSGISSVSGVTRVIGVTRVLLELHLAALVAAVVLGVVLGHKVVQLLAVHLGFEALVLVGSVVDSALVAISVDQLVVSSHLVSVAVFAVLLHIARLVVLDAILEVVLGMRVVMVVVVAMMLVLVVMASLLMVIVVRHQVH